MTIPGMVRGTEYARDAPLSPSLCPNIDGLGKVDLLSSDSRASLQTTNRHHNVGGKSPIHDPVSPPSQITVGKMWQGDRLTRSLLQGIEGTVEVAW